jgi:ubiquinone/menaquinone biosynthesis C-methylase UbiE
MNWDQIYCNTGVIQNEIVPAVSFAVSLLKGRKSLKILDAGCGTGRNLIFIQENLSGSDITGFDSSRHALSLVPSGFHGKKIVFDMNTGALPFKDNEFDLTVSSMVIEHGTSSEIIHNTEELKRVTKPNGLIVFVVPSKKDFRYKTGKEIEKDTFLDTPQLDGTLPHHFFDNTEIVKLFKDYRVLYKKEQARKAVTADGPAYDWEFVFQKK